jgi:bacteriocin-like protein
MIQLRKVRPNCGIGGKHMKKMTIQLTTDQQKQIKDATGKDLTELNLTIPAQEELNESELAQVTGGGKCSLSDFSFTA